MVNEYVLDFDTMNELETLSVKLEQLRNFAGVVNDFVWQKIVEGYEGETINKLGCLTESLLEVICVRENNLDAIIKKIAPCPIR